MRVREVYETYHSFKQFISGDGEANLDVMARDESLEWLASMRDRVDFDELHLTGHSFGGATIVSQRFDHRSPRCRREADHLHVDSLTPCKRLRQMMHIRHYPSPKLSPWTPGLSRSLLLLPLSGETPPCLPF